MKYIKTYTDCWFTLLICFSGDIKKKAPKMKKTPLKMTFDPKSEKNPVNQLIKKNLPVKGLNSNTIMSQFDERKIKEERVLKGQNFIRTLIFKI